MAKVKVITGLNVKGYDFTYTLGQVNMIVGNNGTGKTARLAALRIAILGHEPKLGVQGAATYQLAGAVRNSMRIEATTDIGNTSLDLAMKGGKVSSNPIRPTAFDDVPAVMLDSREFFGLKTSDSRSKFIFSSYKIGDGASSPTSLITKLKAITLEGQTDAHTEALQEIVDQVMDSARNRTRALNENEDCPLQQWLTDQHASIKGTASNAKGNYERMVKSVEATTQHQGAEQQQVYRPIETLKDELDKLRTLGEQLAGELRELVNRQSAAEAKIVQRTALTNSLSQCTPATQEESDLAVTELEKARTEMAAVDTKIGVITGSLAELEKVIEKVSKDKLLRDAKSAELATIKFDETAYQSAIKEVEELQENINGYQSKSGELFAQYKACIAKQGESEAEYNRLAKEASDIVTISQENLAHDACPLCTLKGQEWKLAYSETTAATLATLREKLAGLKTLMADLQIEYKTVQGVLAESQQYDLDHANRKLQLQGKKAYIADTDRLRKAFEDLRLAIQKLDVAGLEGLIDRRKDSIEERNGLLERRKTVQQQIDRLTTVINAWTARKALQARIDDLGEDAPVNYPPLIQAIRTRQDERMATYRTTEMELQKATEAQQDELRKAQSNAEMEKAKARVEIAKACLKVIEQFQKEVVEGVFKTLITRANSLVGPILPAPLEYRDGQIGWQRENLFVTEKTFCGLEEVMTFVAFSLALSPNSPFKLVILDEMGMLSQANRLLLIGQMVLMTKEGIVDQFVGADCEDLYSAIPGVNVIKTT